MSRALFTFTIGPVKSFVNNGRKMKDLYAGSSMLSELTSKAIEWLKLKEKKGQYELSVVFPPEAQCTHKVGETNVPNRLVIDINNYDEEKYRNLGKELTNHVNKEFEEICNRSLKEVGESSDLKIAIEQLAQFLEIFWLFEPYESNAKYAEAYGELINKTNGIKGIRPFSQTYEPWGRKCTLHPEYNAIFVEFVKGKKYPSHTNVEHIIPLSNTERLHFNIKTNEALSAIAFVKRMYHGENSELISPRDLLLKNTLYLNKKTDEWFDNNIKNSDIIKQNGVIMTHLTNAIYDVWDGDIEYDEAKHEYPSEVMEKGQRLRDELKKEHHNLRLQQYYAVIKFDGDSMGGKYSRLKEKKAHKQLSDEICQFAKDARRIVNNKGGICIYAGGEDVLAILTLQNLWCALQQLHERFDQIGKKVVIETSQTFEEVVSEPFTFSAGIAIAHLMQPLKDIMSEVEKAEKRAKDGVKNAFAISLIKRGSEIRSIKYSFSDNYSYLQALAEMVDLFNKDKNSRSFIYNVSHLLLKLSKNSDPEMIHSLIRQAIEHQKIVEDKKVMKNIDILHQVGCIEDLMNTLDVIGFLSGKTIFNRKEKKEVSDDDVQNESH